MNRFEELHALYARLDACLTVQETCIVLADFETLCAQFSPSEKQKYGPEMAKIAGHRLEVAIENVRLERVSMAVEYAGRRYASPEWVTLASYARLHDAALQKVCNWIKRGNIPATDYVEIPELNNLRLIRNKEYGIRKYRARAAV